MKRILLFLLLFPLSSFAQDIYNDILAEGKTWNLCRMDNGKMHVEGLFKAFLPILTMTQGVAPG